MRPNMANSKLHQFKMRGDKGIASPHDRFLTGNSGKSWAIRRHFLALRECTRMHAIKGCPVRPILVWREQLRPRWPKLADLKAASEHDVLAYMSFPRQHRTKLHSTNPIERQNKEVKPRPMLSGSFRMRPPSCA